MLAEYRTSVGRRVSLTCSIDSNPPPSSISWTAPNGRSVDGPIFEIDAAALADQGSYTCLVKAVLTPSNGEAIVRSAQQTTNLIVDHAPGKGMFF